MRHFPRRSPLRLAALISGGGTTLANLIRRIAAGELDARIELVVSSHPQAGGLAVAAQAGIATAVVERRSFATLRQFSSAVFDACRTVDPHLVVMGGFLKLLALPDDFELRVVNIHPALIPAFCGKGFFGLRVQQAVLQYGVKLTGCTVHFVDEHYDHGPVILQRAVPVEDEDTPQSLAARVFQAECEAYPAALRLIASGRLRVDGRRVSVRSDGSTPY